MKKLFHEGPFREVIVGVKKKLQIISGTDGSIFMAHQFLYLLLADAYLTFIVVYGLEVFDSSRYVGLEERVHLCGRSRRIFTVDENICPERWK